MMFIKILICENVFGWLLLEQFLLKRNNSFNYIQAFRHTPQIIIGKLNLLLLILIEIDAMFSPLIQKVMNECSFDCTYIHCKIHLQMIKNMLDSNLGCSYLTK